MNSPKKRLAVYFLFISLGFLIAFLFLRKNNPVAETTTAVVPPKKDSIIVVALASFFTDLENNDDGYISLEKAASGKKSCKLSPTSEFGFLQAKIAKDIPTFTNLKSISVTLKALFEKKDPEAVYVLSIDDGSGKNVFWDGKPIVYTTSKEWTEQTITFDIPAQFLIAENKLSVYPWNKNKNVFYVDDIQIDYIGTGVYQESMANQSEKSNLFFDFETESSLSTADNVKETTAHSGKKACDLSGGKEYGPSVTKKLSEISSTLITKISMSMWVYPLTDNPNIVLTASVVNAKNEAVFWDGESSENKSFPKNQWTKINTSFKLPIEKFTPEDILGVGIWNKGKTDLIVDDLEIVYGESAERRGAPSKVDPISIYEKRFVGEKNKPPFRIIWFEKQDIKNANSSSLTPIDKNKEGAYFSPNDEFFVGDFFPDKSGLDEILCVGPEGKKGLYTYSLEEKQFRVLWSTPLVADSIWNNNNNFYSGDFNVDGKLDILVVDKSSKKWSIQTFNGKDWTAKAQGSKPKSEWLNKNQNETAFPGNYFENKKTTLKLNNEWRFDLKLLDGDNILGNVDFKGYSNDYNPKYYEFVKIVPGNFLSKNQTSLLIVMCNCADVSFKGKYCKQIEELTFLPNKVELYSISPQITQINTDKHSSF